MKKILSMMVFVGILCSLTAFTAGCGDPAKKTTTPAATTPTKTSPTPKPPT